MKNKKISENTMQSYWRQAVRIKFNNKCAICWNRSGLECHHYIKRRAILLRHDLKNGILLCQNCHKIAHTKEGNKKIEEILKDDLDYLWKYEKINLKDFCREFNLSREEFLINELRELKNYIKEN